MFVAAAILGLAGLQSVAAAPRVITLPTETIGSTEPTAEAPQAARHEAGAVLAEAKLRCGKEDGQDQQRACLAAARDDYRQQMDDAKSQGTGSK
ncbi:MAG: hypothetical protein ABI364_01430 [Caldimonas sp.]